MPSNSQVIAQVKDLQQDIYAIHDEIELIHNSLVELCEYLKELQPTKRKTAKKAKTETVKYQQAKDKLEN